MSEPVVVGVDAGGTKSALRAAVGPATVDRTGPGAQALRDGTARVVETLAELVTDALAEAGGPLAALAVGLAGAGREATQDEIRRGLAARLGDAPIRVVHDADVAYHAAWGDESGALLLVGTGSLVFARDEDGQALRAGGWGPILGDDGSGTALGRAALRALLATFDGGPPSALPQLAAERLGLDTPDDVFRAVYTEERPLAAFASLALAAVDAGDWTAETALRAETNALAKQAAWLATRGDGRILSRLRYAGGLTSEPTYRAALDDALSRHLPGWQVGLCEAEPVDGALAMAQRLAAAS